MNIIRLLLILILTLWHWTTNGRNSKVFVGSVFVTNQSQLDQFIGNMTASNDKGNTNNIQLTLSGDTSYVLDIVKLMKISITDSSLIMKSEEGLAEINCIASESDLEKLREVVQPISRASILLMDGLVFTGCPVPIMIEEVDDVMIKNCVFKNHEHGALSIYNSKSITVTNCTFHNNTSDSYFTRKSFQGSAGGLSIGYNSSGSYFTEPSVEDNDPVAAFDGYNFTTTRIQDIHPLGAFANNNFDIPDILIINCKFTENSAILPAGQGGSSNDALINNVFHGRGGALSILVNTDLITFEFCDNIVMNNFAEVFGGGVYCLTQRGSSQRYTFSNNVFINNTGPQAGGLALIYLIIPKIAIIIHIYHVYNCTFYNNSASEMAGAAIISAVYGLATNIFVTFKDCNFSNNAATIHGGAVDIISYYFFDNIQAESLIRFINCTFEGNVAADGAAMNLVRYGAKFCNVTFKNNRESAVRMIGCVVEIHDEVNFVGNEAKNGGALYIISFGQIKVFRDTALTFKENGGRIGASIVVLTKRFSQAPAYSQLIYNPDCFLLYQDSKVPFSSVDNLKLKFIDNNALEAAAIFMHTAQQCSWISYSPPYFDPAAVLKWKFLDISDSSNNSQNTSHIEASIIYIDVLEDDVGVKYPGEQFSLTMKMTDEMNQPVSGFMQLDVVNVNNQSTTKYKIHPAIVYHHSTKPLNVAIVIETNTRINYGTNVTVVVKEFMRSKKSIASNFTLRVVSCLAGYELKYDSVLNGFTCKHYRGNTHIGTCKEDRTVLLLTDGQWGLDQPYTEQPENLTVYPCPPGYCRCFHNLCGVGDEICNFAYFNNKPDKQCNCDREGYLCGDCKDSKGVSTLLNRCVDCGDINASVLAALFIVNTTLIIVMLCKDFSFSALLFPTIFFINMVSYVGESYPTSYDQVGRYIYFINSLLSLYFPYDFCLYSGATPLATYSFRYLPLCLTVIICSIGLILHRHIFKRVKRFSWNNLWLLLTLQYSHVVYTSITILHCPQVINENGEHESRWFVKGTLECFTGYHISLALCAIFVLVMCVLLIPFLGLVATGKLKRPYWVSKLTKHLQCSFKENLPWWCMVELGRKVIFLLLLIPFPQNTAPPMFTLMTTFAVYAYVLPYKEMFVNITELFFQLSLLIFLILRSTKSIVDNYLRFPYHKYNDDMDTTRCSSETGTANLTWILFPFAYLPLTVIIGILSLKILIRLWQCVCYKDRIKKHNDQLLQEKSKTNYRVNVTNTNYFLLGVKDDTIAFVDATTDDDN